MAYNLFIAYDLLSPEQSYEKVIRAIRALGTTWQFQLSLWYVHTDCTPNEAFAVVHAAMDANDKLAVINASGGVVSDWDKPPLDAINAIWSSS